MLIEALKRIHKPHITEKSTRMKEGAGVLCFRVDSAATKIDVRNAVERIFDVKVAEVRIANMPGKLKRQRGFQGMRPGWRKAYVKLKPGQKSVEYFEGV